MCLLIVPNIYQMFIKSFPSVNEKRRDPVGFPWSHGEEFIPGKIPGPPKTTSPSLFGVNNTSQIEVFNEKQITL